MSSRMLVMFPVAVLILSGFAIPSTAKSGSTTMSLERDVVEHLRLNGMEPLGPRDGEEVDLFQAFFTGQPEDSGWLHEDVRANILEPQMIPRHAIASLNHLVGTFEAIVNDELYIVELRSGRLEDGSEYLKATFVGPDGIHDPWFYITRSTVWARICYVFCFWIPVGDDYWLYVDFVTNSNGVNEAAIFKSKVGEWAILGGSLAGLVGFILGALTEGAGGIIAVAGGYQAAWVNHVIQTAYDPSRGIRVAAFLRWFYSGFGFFALWAYWWIDSQWHRAIPAPLLDLFALQVNSALRSVMVTIGNTFGWNRWFWAGPYRG